MDTHRHYVYYTIVSHHAFRTTVIAGRSPISDIAWGQSYKFAVPAALYAANNNLVFYILTLIPPAVFQIIGNVKTVWIALVRIN